MTTPSLLCPSCGGSMTCLACRKKESVEKRHLILTEGIADQRFLEALLVRRGLDAYQVLQPAGSESGFGERLKGIKINSGTAKAELIILVADRDSNSVAKKLRTLTRQVVAAGFEAPTEPLKPSGKPPGLPRLAILILPWENREGCLETLLIDAFEEQWPDIVTRAEKFIEASHTGSLTVSKRSKAIAACVVAGVCLEDPSRQIANIWQYDAALQHLLDSARFGRVVDYLRAAAT